MKKLIYISLIFIVLAACEKEHTKAYCGDLYWKIHGKKKGAGVLLN